MIIHPKGQPTGTVVILEGVKVHVKKDVMSEEGSSLEMSRLRPVARLGGITYALMGEVSSRRKTANHKLP